MYSILNFGKHKGKSLPEIILNDPDWFFWAIENHVLERSGLAAQARDLNFKACNIKLPKPETEHWRVNYLFDHRDKFCGFKLVQVSSAAEAHPNRLDLSVVYQHKRRDKLGNTLMLRSFKSYYVGYASVKLTRAVCEQFFDNGANFYQPKSPERHVSKLTKLFPKNRTSNDGTIEDKRISEEQRHAIS